VSNGTVALHLALVALGVGVGDEVLLPSLTFVATANAVKYVGAEPVFVDVDPATWAIDPNLIAQRITPRTKGIIVVHLYGHPADMDAINAVAAAHGLWVIEDAAEAHFAHYKGSPVGSMSTMATFSFFGNKAITCGEGGAITLNDPELAAHVRQLRGQGMDPKRRYYFPIIGYNYRLTNVACAILCAQLEHREMLIGRRKRVFTAYDERLAGIPGIGFQPVASWAEPTPWLYSIVVNEDEYGRPRDELMALLADHGIESRPFFIPIHSLPPYREGSARRGERLPITDFLGSSGMNLPTFGELTDDEIDQISSVIKCSRK
jgi:perosamine synthetase